MTVIGDQKIPTRREHPIDDEACQSCFAVQHAIIVLQETNLTDLFARARLEIARVLQADRLHRPPLDSTTLIVSGYLHDRRLAGRRMFISHPVNMKRLEVVF